MGFEGHATLGSNRICFCTIHLSNSALLSRLTTRKLFVQLKVANAKEDLQERGGVLY